MLDVLAEAAEGVAARKQRTGEQKYKEEFE